MLCRAAESLLSILWEGLTDIAAELFSMPLVEQMFAFISSRLFSQRSFLSFVTSVFPLDKEGSVGVQGVCWKKISSD